MPADQFPHNESTARTGLKLQSLLGLVKATAAYSDLSKRHRGGRPARAFGAAHRELREKMPMPNTSEVTATILRLISTGITERDLLAAVSC